MNRRYTLADLYIDPNLHIEKCSKCGVEPRWHSLERHRLYCEKCDNQSTHWWYERYDTVEEWNRMNRKNGDENGK
ncbi:MAG: hypothetical protein ACI4TK_16535 [Agathobacter sp.]